MKPLTYPPVDFHPGPRARARSSAAKEHHRWLHRFGNSIVERKLAAAMLGLVRQEKYASARIVSLRIARELEEPLRSLDRHIAALEQLAAKDSGIRRLVECLRGDRQVIVDALRRVEEIEPPNASVA